MRLVSAPRGRRWYVLYGVCLAFVLSFILFEALDIDSSGLQVTANTALSQSIGEERGDAAPRLRHRGLAEKYRPIGGGDERRTHRRSTSPRRLVVAPLSHRAPSGFAQPASSSRVASSLRSQRYDQHPIDRASVADRAGNQIQEAGHHE